MPTRVGESGRRSVGEVLAAGWSLFIAGLGSVFPWVLAAELVQELPFANPPGGILDTDLSLLAQPAYLARALLCGVLQALLYAVAVLRLTRLTGGLVPGNLAWNALRATPSLFFGYLAYEICVVAGLGLTLLVLAIGLALFGLLPGLVMCLIPLAPTAALSTSLALFVYPAVLERRGPLAALQESTRLAKSSWGRVTLVISVPALVLLAAAITANAPDIHRSLMGLTDDIRRLQDLGSSQSGIQTALAMVQSPGSPSRYGAWQLASVVLGAFAWWYALAVCYAQYRDLKKPH